jgi:hypothetical protein
MHSCSNHPPTEPISSCPAATTHPPAHKSLLLISCSNHPPTRPQSLSPPVLQQPPTQPPAHRVYLLGTQGLGGGMYIQRGLEPHLCWSAAHMSSCLPLPVKHDWTHCNMHPQHCPLTTLVDALALDVAQVWSASRASGVTAELARDAVYCVGS